jgi:hypothetical protein
MVPRAFMVATDFAKFVANQQESREEREFDWAAEREKWLSDLDSLYGQVIGFLREYIDSGQISYSFANIELTEEDLGTYTARRMDIKIGRQHVSLEPIGTLLIGCRGRVDVVGTAGRAQLLLLNEQAKSPFDLVSARVGPPGGMPPTFRSPEEPITWVWKIVAHAVQKVFVDLDKDSFFALLMEVGNG